MEPGDLIAQADGTPGEVQSSQVTIQPQMMWDLTVADAHTFFVGTGQSLVHNSDKCKLSNDGKPWYGDLDEHDRPTGAFAHLEGKPSRGSKIKSGTKGWNPPELDTKIHDRTHLLARDFGGHGQANNRVIAYKRVNQSGGPMRKIELEIEHALKRGEAIDYAVVPIYPQGSSTFIPDFIAIEVYGNRGTRIVEVIPNVP